LPPEFKDLAIEFKSFTRGSKIKTVEELLRMVLLYCGLDLSFREVASNMTLLDERITDEAVRKRLKACQPWVKALLSNMLDSKNLDNLPSSFRFCAFDGSSIQASRQKFFSKTFASKAATGTDYRLHIGIDLVTLEFTHLLVTDKRTGESLKHYSLNKRDVAVVDRGYCHALTIYEKKKLGSYVIVRYNHATMPLYKDDATPLDLVSELKKSRVSHLHNLKKGSPKMWVMNCQVAKEAL
jgi:hypothetical protein